MLKTSFTLTSKKQLTHDVYELIYSCPDLLKKPPLPGQYVLFQLAPGLNRAYSLSSFYEDTFTLIIKRISEGRGSPIICDAKVGDIFHGIIPLGHFTLQNTQKNKCFIGTGTGYAPLYCQLLGCKNTGITDASMAFIFGVRAFRDSFHENELQELGRYFTNFEYHQYFSREDDSEEAHGTYRHGYVTDWITKENISTYEEFYLCGSPPMVKGARERLEALGVHRESIFWEQF